MFVHFEISLVIVHLLQINYQKCTTTPSKKNMSNVSTRLQMRFKLEYLTMTGINWSQLNNDLNVTNRLTGLINPSKYLKNYRR